MVLSPRNVCAHMHVQTGPHDLHVSSPSIASSQCVTSICKVSTQQGKIEKIWGSRIEGELTVGWCEDESPFTLARSFIPTQHHAILQG